MLPAHIAENIRRQVLYYLQSTFDFRDRTVTQAFEKFLQDPEQGLFKGPWVQLRRPFRLVNKPYTPPFDLTLSFLPFRHQSVAWRRLTSKNHKPEPTLITTGTGSGKTECFLYPLLDHCLRAKQTGHRGIKAIVLYPMNALATDQERRFAKAICENPALKKAGIRVGTYTGRYDPSDPTSQDSGTTNMGKDHGITNHETQLENPPDILLTNYKMLDFLLLRPQDQKLWRYNQPSTLQYLVLDELHTYDGAQGADVACLIRRLKERLAIPKGNLCIIGTSATMDDRDRSDRASGLISIDAVETGGDRLARFASTLFEEDIPTEAVIVEDRLTVEEIVKPEEELISLDLPTPEDCSPQADEDATAYAIRQTKLWGGPEFEEPTQGDRTTAVESWSIALGDWLKGTQLFKHLLELFDTAERSFEGPLTWTKLAERLAAKDFSFIAVPNQEERRRIITAFFAIVAHAKEIRSNRAFPLVPTQVQLWVRELARIGRIVSEKPEFGWLDEPSPEPILPAFQCNECGASGWIGFQNRQSESAVNAKGVQGFQLTNDVKTIYNGWFGRNSTHDSRIVLIVPDKNGSIDTGNLFGVWYLHPASLVLRQGEGACPLTKDTRRVRVAFNQDVEKLENNSLRGVQACPCCGSREGIFIIGSRSATLSSVMVDELFGSMLNSDPKLLAFTDSVQDASHRAGFLSARTYNFSFRTALQRVIDHAGAEGLPLPEVGRRLLEWWGTPGLGRPGTMKKAISALLPPDLHSYQDYLNYRNNPKLTYPPKSLAFDIETRLTWQATNEFGIMLLRGRTIEASGSACVAWDWQKIEQTVQQISDRIESVDTQLRNLSPDNIRRWLLGLLYRYRLRGAIGHLYLEDLAQKNYWGKAPFGRSISGREVHPPLTRYRPKLMVTRADKHHDFIFGNTSGNTQPWHIRWTHRTLNLPMTETETIDLLRLLYEAAETTKLLLRLHTDSNKIYYAINPAAVRLVPNGVRLICSETGRQIVRPPHEASLWVGAPSLEYSANNGAYSQENFTRRQLYYQDRYRKGALRRVIANEHTGLLATEEREQLERTFSRNEHTDDPNVLTCTSTLEMGIDIGDLSSTMLCSIPPTTASYLQRIGRAGRATGTALIVSVINHQPHDLFFYARPVEMLRGKVDPPGCWVDASAVLVRQYLAYCFDSAAKTGHLVELPRTGTLFIRDMENTNGHFPSFMDWVAQNQAQLQQSFLARFTDVIREDTKTRFYDETVTELLLQRIRKVANEFDRQRREIENARRRLQNQKSQLEEHEEEARREIEDELRVLKGRQNSLSRITTLELLTDHGLLPNYAFPESGVRFYGSVYNRHRVTENPVPPIEIVRPAANALRELAPHNFFYTHKRQFEIQQISIGSKEEPVTETWAICGQCGHIRLASSINQEPACPQCGYDGGHDSQADIGQHRSFIEFSRSEAISVMEQYDSLSSDRSDEREHTFYQRRRSFDLTVDAPTGAVGEESLPFGIEYRAAVVLREVNVGYFDEAGSVAFGPEGPAPDRGFQVCVDCGVVATPGKSIEQVTHRRSCSARRRQEKAKAEGRSVNSFKAESVYLYREIRSEAIRILVPSLSDDEIATLEACLLLGLRLRFEGDPSHLTIFPQRLPDGENNLQRDYLIILDRVPGGTGYLKTLFQETDATGRTGEGIITVMQRALDALETCRCGRLSEKESDRDTDGCYRCIRTYSQQHSATSISRERGIKLLKQLLAAGDRRQEHQALTEIPNKSLLGSALERKFINKLEEWVNERNGTWETTLVFGKTGFRFSLPNTNRTWELELQPQLRLSQGVSISCQPDFMLRCADDESILPVAIFTDGFEFHVETNRLADDMAKRRAILLSGRYHIWNITWDDLSATNLEEFLVVPKQIAAKVDIFATTAISKGLTMPMGRLAIGNPWQQLTGFIQRPEASGWRRLAEFIAAFPLEVLAATRVHAESTLRHALNHWRNGQDFIVPPSIDSGEWVCYDRTSGGSDVIALSTIADCLANRRDQVRVTARLGDSESERSANQTYRPRWRKFLACLNLLQFCGAFVFFTTSEVEAGTAPDVLPNSSAFATSGEWADIRAEVIPSLQYVVDELAVAGVAIPQAAYEDEEIDSTAIAELAWVSPRIAVLAGDQALLVSTWEANGWTVVTADELQAKGTAFLIELIGTETRGNS
ncbi:MAG: DEAD/DEAH box helicase [Scytonema sp. PMC 1069.18]|nr:DEAD/DEAH box helicase [Scytonema sp. PMC 1069.18]MEC4883576.1 DEAD/DEAH box helicase [Scytonema sp. PMC 1070.18]